MTHRYEKHDPAGNNSGNSRNGTRSKTVKGDFGELEIEVPRDRVSTFEPQILPKHQTRFAGFDDKIISMYARGMTTREIEGHLKEIYGVEVSAGLISQVTEAVSEEVKTWQNRALEPIYGIVYLDALYVKMRHEGRVENRAVYVALGVDLEGHSAYMDIWQSGGYKDGSDGVPPVSYTFPAAPGQALTFSSVTRTWSCGNDATPNGPDGTDSGSCYVNVNNFVPVGPFSGLEMTDFSRPLVGMFLADTLPTSAPPTLRFYWSDSSPGGIQTNFATLSPQIGQVFFIGDGLTGTGTGAIQAFSVPSTATHLYLGYVDLCSAGGPPGCYSDNSGSMTATFAISECAFQVSDVTPQIQLADRAWATQAGIMVSWKSGKSISGAAAATIADSIAPATTVFAIDYADGGVPGCAELDDCSISLSDYTQFLSRLGITQADTTPSACGLAERLRKFRPMTIVTGTPTANFVPAEVLTGVTGDGTASGAAVNYIEPATGSAASVSFASLLLGIEAAVAAGWPEFVQFP